MRAHRAMSCSGYSRTDFIVSAKGPIYLETNTLPGLTAASLYPKALKAQGIEFADFLRDQIVLAEGASRNRIDCGTGRAGEPGRSGPKLLKS